MKCRRYYENYTLYFRSDEGTLFFCSEEWKMKGIEWDSEGDYKVYIGKMKREKKELFLVRKVGCKKVWKGKGRNYFEKHLTSQQEGYSRRKRNTNYENI